MTGMGYGENADYNDIQSSAPLAATPPAARQRAGARQAQPQPQVVPLMSPTRRPTEPVTAGASFGPGPTENPVQQEIANRQARRPTVVDTLSKIAPLDTTGRLQSVVNYLRSVE